MQPIDTIISLLDSPVFDWVLKGVLVYLAALWFAIVIWVGRDIIHRTNNVLFQVLVILLNIILPVFGLILYLIIRPGKTLLEKYYEELEYNFLADQGSTEESCPRCETALSPEFLFCPNCSEKMKSSCSHCKQSYLSQYHVCPYCGKKDQKKHHHGKPQHHDQEKKK
jgi:RNA polymerase subunit RPABC4/transcription elongation factor Spt4